MKIIAHEPGWEEALKDCSAIRTITFRPEEFLEEYDRTDILQEWGCRRRGAGR